MDFDVLILAGGEAPEGLKRHTDYNTKATLKLGGRLMIEHVVDALRAAPGVNRILVVGAKDPLERVLGDKVWKVAQPEETMLGNLRIGLDAFKDSKWLLVSTCDIPLITGDMVGRYIAQCDTDQGDLFFPAVEKRLNDEKYPNTRRTYARLRGVTFTGGNVVLMRPNALNKSWPSLEAAIAARKSPLKLVRIIGIGFLFKFLFRLATIRDIETRVGRIFGFRPKGILVKDPEIGIDVDKVSDYELVASVIERK